MGRAPPGPTFDEALRSCFGRVFGVTEKGYMGMLPDGAAKGDIVCGFAGAKTPFVIQTGWRGIISVDGGVLHSRTDEWGDSGPARGSRTVSKIYGYGDRKTGKRSEEYSGRSPVVFYVAFGLPHRISRLTERCTESSVFGSLLFPNVLMIPFPKTVS